MMFSKFCLKFFTSSSTPVSQHSNTGQRSDQQNPTLTSALLFLEKDPLDKLLAPLSPIEKLLKECIAITDSDLFDSFSSQHEKFIEFLEENLYDTLYAALQANLLTSSLSEDLKKLELELRDIKTVLTKLIKHIDSNKSAQKTFIDILTKKITSCLPLIPKVISNDNDATILRT